jgi:hypothetical protein
MPLNKKRRCLKLDWAIYLRENENRLFSGAELQANDLKQNQTSLVQSEFQSEQLSTV